MSMGALAIGSLPTSLSRSAGLFGGRRLIRFGVDLLLDEEMQLKMVLLVCNQFAPEFLPLPKLGK